jgi:hypothetical protein
LRPCYRQQINGGLKEKSFLNNWVNSGNVKMVEVSVEATNKISATLEIVWYEEFFKNPELSLPKSLQEYVGRKVQRSEIEDSDSNNISVDGVIYQLPRSARQPEMVDDMIQTVS